MITNGGIQCVPLEERTKVKQVIKWCKKSFEEIKEIEIFHNEINLLVPSGMVFEIVVEKDKVFMTGVFYPAKTKDFFKTAAQEFSLTREGLKRGFKETVEAMKAELGKGFNSILKKEKNSEYISEGNRFSFIKYPLEYKVKPIREQIGIIREVFPQVKTVDENFALRLLPSNAENWFVVPRWQIVANTYNEAVKNILDLIQEKWRDKFCNWCKYQGKFWVNDIVRSKHTEEQLKILAGQQGNSDALIIPAQFGYRHRDRNISRAYEVFSVNEFGLGIFEVGCMILTHPKRFNYDSLWIDCVDEYKQVLCFVYRIKKFGLELETHAPSIFSKRIGIATGFIA